MINVETGHARIQSQPTMFLIFKWLNDCLQKVLTSEIGFQLTVNMTITLLICITMVDLVQMQVNIADCQILIPSISSTPTTGCNNSVNSEGQLL